MLDRAHARRHRGALVAADPARRLRRVHPVRADPGRPRHLAQGPHRAAQPPRGMRGARAQALRPATAVRVRPDREGPELFDAADGHGRVGGQVARREAGPPVLYRHHACGEISRVDLRCAHCGSRCTRAMWRAFQAPAPRPKGARTRLVEVSSLPSCPLRSVRRRRSRRGADRSASTWRRRGRQASLRRRSCRRRARRLARGR